MSLGKLIVSAAIAAVVVSGAARAEESAILLKPAKGVSVDVGSTHVVSYFLAKGGSCKLTVMMADSAEIDAVKGAATRVAVTVEPARPFRIDTAEGKSLEFACGPAASEMSARILDRVAYATRG